MKLNYWSRNKSPNIVPPNVSSTFTRKSLKAILTGSSWRSVRGKQGLIKHKLELPLSPSFQKRG